MRHWLLATVLLVAACKRRAPEQWIGMDRTTVSCADDGNWLRATCVGGGRIYTCVRDWGERTWRCAEQRVVAPMAEAP